MSFHDILVYLDRTAHSTHRLTLAADLAARHQAGLIGLRLEIHPHVPEAFRGGIKQSALETQAQAIAADTKRIEADFRAAAASRAVPAEWWTDQLETDWAIERVCLRARHAGLTVVGQAAHDGEEEIPGHALLHALLLTSGRPVLVVPETPTVSVPGTRVAVAWNATRESARAVADAMPLLEAAQAVMLVQIGTGSDNDLDSLGEISRHLLRNKVANVTQVTRAPDHDVGAVILGAAGEFGADLLVMGGYGHSRMREVVLGGATRHILKAATIPVLMSH
jgi:nucleotide-binding universal stress UspA family protein